MKVQYKISDRLEELSQVMVVDSVPVPVVKLARERTYRPSERILKRLRQKAIAQWTEAGLLAMNFM